MKERPILFSAPMVRAILAGTKTQTRRAIKLTDSKGRWDEKGFYAVTAGTIEKMPWSCTSISRHVGCPYGEPGDRLWVRETFAIVPRTAYRCSEGVQQTLRPDDPYEHDAAIYREGWTRSRGGFRWRPSIHMPRWASRITLEVTGVRVERLRDISEDDARAEGSPWAACGAPQDGSHKAGFAQLWESINGPGSWVANPWVWVVEFKRLEAES
jgi:hypothetical protein